MKLAWMFCFLLVGKLSTASPVDESTAAAESGVGSGYMMAFPMDDDQVAEESIAQEAVKMLADSLASEDEEDKKEDASEDKKEEEDATEQPEPMNILQAELDAEEEAERPALPQRPFFKRPKIEELRKILGFPAPEGPAAKSKPIPQEKPKVFTGLFNKPKPKLEVTTQQSPLGGIQYNLRREDRMRVPFGLPMLSPLKRDSPFGFPDLVQAASSLLRRAIVDDNSENDITSKDDKDEDDEENNQNDADDNEEEEDDDSLMIVPIPDSKEVGSNAERPPLFRRFPIPFPFPKPSAQAQNNRPRLPFPPLTPVAFFLPIAQQIMQNIRHAQPRSQPPPMMHIPHPAQNFIPIQTQMPIIPIHHPQPQPQQHFIHIQPQQQHFIPIQPQQQQHFIPIQPQQQQHFIPQQFIPQQFIPQQFIPQPQQLIPFIQQASMHMPVLTHVLPNMPQQQQQRPMMQRRMPVHHPAPHQIPRRPMMPMARSLAPQLQQQQPIFIHRPIQQQQQQQRPSMPQRPPMPPVHPVFFMMPMPAQPVPVFHKPPQQQQHFMAPPRHFPEDERVVFVRNDQPEDDDQEVLILVPSDEVEVQQRPPVFMPPQQQLMRHVPTPVVNPLQRIRLLRDLLMARRHQQQQQAMMSPQDRAARVVEIVQQQLRIFPAHHNHHQSPMVQRADPSELHPVYVPYPGPQ